MDRPYIMMFLLIIRDAPTINRAYIDSLGIHDPCIKIPINKHFFIHYSIKKTGLLVQPLSPTMLRVLIKAYKNRLISYFPVFMSV